MDSEWARRKRQRQAGAKCRHELRTCPCCDGSTIACDGTYPCLVCQWNDEPHGYIEQCKWCGEPMGNERRKWKAAGKPDEWEPASKPIHYHAG